VLRPLETEPGLRRQRRGRVSRAQSQACRRVCCSDRDAPALRCRPALAALATAHTQHIIIKNPNITKKIAKQKRTNNKQKASKRASTNKQADRPWPKRYGPQTPRVWAAPRFWPRKTQTPNCLETAKTAAQAVGRGHWTLPLRRLPPPLLRNRHSLSRPPPRPLLCRRLCALSRRHHSRARASETLRP
jgi:hypothetical protein